jgi:hypothetical protein
MPIAAIMILIDEIRRQLSSEQQTDIYERLLNARERTTNITRRQQLDEALAIMAGTHKDML